MQVAVYSTKPYDETFLNQANTLAGSPFELIFFKPALDPATAPGAQAFEAVCAFVNDDLSRTVLEVLAAGAVRVVALRCAGFNNVDLAAAQELGIAIVRVPEYSPYAVAEHVIALLMGLSRKTHRAWNRVREGNFSLEGLLGFDIYGNTAGVIGTGKIGAIVADILRGMGCRVLAHDIHESARLVEAGVTYLPLEALWPQCDIVSLHCPLLPATRHLINGKTLARMKDGVALINTSRGGLVDTEAVYEALKSGKVGYLGLDVYEEEAGLFFEDHSAHIIQDDLIMRLTTFPNVLITGHQAFFTRNALENIAQTTIDNLSLEANGQKSPNRIYLPA